MGISEFHQPRNSSHQCELEIYGYTGVGRYVPFISLVGPPCDTNEGLGVQFSGSSQDNPDVLLSRRAAFFATHGGAAACHEVITPIVGRLDPDLAQALEAENHRLAIAQLTLVEVIEAQRQDAPLPTPVSS